MAFMDELKDCLEQALKKGGVVAEQALKKGGEFAEQAVKKGGEVAESAKLNISLKNNEIKLNKLFTKLGMLVYAKAEDPEIAATVVDIDDIKELIESIKDEIRANNGKILCPGCAKELNADVAFCQYCGAKIEHPEPEEETVEDEATVAEEVETVIVDKESDEFVKSFAEVVKKYDL